jgi:hypothetical protein
VGVQGSHRHVRPVRLVVAVLVAVFAALVFTTIAPTPSRVGAQQTPVTTVAAPQTGSSTTSVAASTSVNDRSSTRKVQMIVGALTALGLLFASLVVWYWKSTKPVPAHLEGLDLLATRKYQRAPDDTRDVLLARLDAKRPDPAPPTILPDAQILPDGHVGHLGAAVAVANETVASHQSLDAHAATQLGNSNGARLVAPPTGLPLEPLYLHAETASPDPLIAPPASMSAPSVAAVPDPVVPSPVAPAPAVATNDLNANQGSHDG